MEPGQGTVVDTDSDGVLLEAFFVGIHGSYNLLVQFLCAGVL